MPKFNRITSSLLAAEILLSANMFCACKKDSSGTESEKIYNATSIVNVGETSGPNDSSSATTATVPTATTASTVATTTTDPSATSQIVSPGSSTDTLSYKTNLVSFEAPRSYVFDKGSAIDTDTECSMSFLKNPNDKVSNHFSISIKSETANEYRNWLTCFVSLEKYSSGELETTSIGGYDFISFPQTVFSTRGNLEMTIYFYRDEKSGMSIVIKQGPSTPSIDELMTNIVFSLPDLGLSDPAFPWQQEAPAIEPTTNTIADYSISTKQIPFKERVYTSGYGSGIVPISYTAAQTGLSDEYLYTLDLGRDTLMIYKIEPDGLELINTVPVSDENVFDEVSFTDGMTIRGLSPASIGMTSTCMIEKGENTNLIQIYGDIAISPDDSILIAYSVNMIKSHKLTYDEASGRFTTTPISFEFPLTDPCVLDMNVTENHILVLAEQRAENIPHTYVFDLDGNFQMELLDGNGEPTSFEDIFEVDGGFIALDSFPMCINMWDKDGKYLGTLSEEELVGFKEEDDEFFQTVSMNLWKKSGENGGASDFILVMSHKYDGSIEDFAFQITVTK